MSTTASNRVVGFVSTLLSCVAIAGLVWALTPHPRSYTVAADTAVDAPQIARTDAVNVASSRP